MKNPFPYSLSCTWLLVSLLLCACSFHSKLEESLRFAGENRGELEKVLAHYKKEPEKWAAARFLIENMPHWYGYKGEPLDSILPILAEGAKNYYIPDEVVKKWKDFSFYSLPKVYDSHVITADYLIENIDLAFQVRDKYPWNRQLDFRDFCELILPYRIGDEPLSNWRREYHAYYTGVLDSLYHGTDVVEACHVLAANLKKRDYHYNTAFRLPRLSGHFLFHNRIGYCREACDITLYAMRASGIPVAIDQFVYSPEYQHSHMWCVVRDTTGRYLPFWFTQYEARRDLKDDGRKKGKIYRSCFGRQEKTIPENIHDASVPFLFRNRFVQDVTANYTGENEVTVPVEPASEKYVYLGVFSPQEWIPIDITRNENGWATFRNLETDILYQPLYSDGKKQRPAGYPFLFTGGKAHVLKPDLLHVKRATLTRKMSLIRTIREFLYRNMIGARVEGANDPIFRNACLLYEITDTLRTNQLEILWDSSSRFRYVRYVSPPGKQIELAEFSLFRDTACKQRIPLKMIHKTDPERNIEQLTDGNILSYYLSKDTACFITFDLGRPEEIRKVVINPRNDDNYIWPDDQYELLYQNGTDGWRSLGIQKATGRELHFEVPENALLWLRDLTKGKEEQVFIYQKDKQYFTMDIHGER